MNNEVDTEMSHEDRLKAIAYQFVVLYERWSEDRQLAVKQGADTAELVKVFTDQVKQFKSFEPVVREQIKAAVQTAAFSGAKGIIEEASKSILASTNETTIELKNAANKAKQILSSYQDEVKANSFTIILASLLTTVITCLLLVWLVIPKPTLPLTHTQISELQGGYFMAEIWPKLSKQEKNHLLQLVDKAQAKELGSGS